MHLLTKKVILVIVSILTGILFYTAIGIWINIVSVRIYDEFPEWFTIYPPISEIELKCSIYNNAPLTFPYINPFYVVCVTVIEPKNGTFAFFKDIGGKKCNFTDYVIDLGRIDPGDSRRFSFFLHVYEGNITFRVETFLQFISFKIPAISATYSIAYLGNYNYTISKIK